MKKNRIKEVFLLLMLTTLSILILSSIGSAETLEVDDDAEPDWYDMTHVHTIQEAINNASGGDSIFVYNGDYTETVYINKSVQINGESTDGVICDYLLVDGSGNFFEIKSDNVSIQNLTISNVTSVTSESAAIWNQGNFSLFSNLNLIDNSNAIIINNSKNLTISDNFIENNLYGIYIFDSENITVIDNSASNNTNFGISLVNSNYNIICHNRFIDNIEADISLDQSNENLFYDNFLNTVEKIDVVGENNIWNITLTDNIDGRELNIIGGDWFGGNYWSEYNGIDIYSGPNQDILGADGIIDLAYDEPEILIDYYPLTYVYSQLYVDDDAEPDWYDMTHVHTIQEAVNNASLGASIYVFDGYYPLITFIDKSVFIMGESTDGVIVTDTMVVSGDFSIIENLTVANVSPLDDFQAAIFDESSNSSYKNLHIFNSTYGIHLSESSGGTSISNSTIEYNDYGIYLESSDINVIFGNYLINNEIGLLLEFSSFNLIYNNYFDNILNAEIWTEVFIENSWNLPEVVPGENIIGGPYLGGNYWNNYTGIDIDADGIGDSPYLVYSGWETEYYDIFPLTDNANTPPTLGTPLPANESTNNPLELEWSIPINDDQGWFSWNISCSNGQNIGSSEDENGTKTIHLSDLSYSTTYTIYVNVYDWTLWTNQTFTFTTKDKPHEEKKEPINRPPIARPGGPYTSFPNGQIQFDGGSSSDPDGYITSYTWTFGDGNSATGETCTHSYSNEGTYTITLTVVDNKGKTGSSTTTAVIVKPNNPPEIQSSIDYDHEELTVQLSITVTDADGDDISCTINWDDSTSTSLSLISGESATQSHTYSAYGLYSIQITANDGSTDTSKTHTFSLFTEENKEKGSSSGFSGFLSIHSENESFLENQIDGRSLFGNSIDKKYVIPAATAASIILLFLFNFLIEFFSDYSSEHALDFRKDKKDKSKKNKKRSLSSHKYLNKRELLSVLVTTILLSFVLTWTWVSDFSAFIQLFLITLIIVALIFFIRESIRSYLCHKQNIQSEFYVWPLGSMMMIVSTVIGNTFSLAANHHYDENGDIKKCGRVNFTVSLFMYLVVLSAFITNLIYPSIVLQMIVIVSILNLFIDLFPFRPMDGYELRQWNLPIWAVMYVLVFISYVVVYFNLFP